MSTHQASEITLEEAIFIVENNKFIKEQRNKQRKERVIRTKIAKLKQRKKSIDFYLGALERQLK